MNENLTTKYSLSKNFIKYLLSVLVVPMDKETSQWYLSKGMEVWTKQIQTSRSAYKQSLVKQMEDLEAFADDGQDILEILVDTHTTESELSLIEFMEEVKELIQEIVDNKEVKQKGV